MDTTLTELRQALAHFLDREVAAGVVAGEANAVLAPEWSERLGDLGYLDFGADQGAGGLGLLAEAIVVAEIARVWGALAVSVAAALLAARGLDCARPGHGLSASALRSGRAAVAVGRLSAGGGRIVVGPARPDMLLFMPCASRHELEVTFSATPSNWPLDSTEYEGLRGLRGVTVPERPGHLLDVGVSADLLAADRILLAAVAAGLAQGALDKGIAYAIDRVQFGRPIGAYGEIQALLARASTRAVTARHTALFAAQLFDDRERSVELATRAFLGASEAAVRVGERAQHVHGGYGHMSEYQIGRYVRDARTLASLAGSHSELDRLLAQEMELPL